MFCAGILYVQNGRVRRAHRKITPTRHGAHGAPYNDKRQTKGIDIQARGLSGTIVGVRSLGSTNQPFHKVEQPPPHLLAGRPIVREIIQHGLTAEKLGAEILRLINNPRFTTELGTVFSAIHTDLRRDANRAATAAVLDLVGRNGD